MIGPSRLHRYTYEDYVSVELTSSSKHEFLNGAIGDRPCRVHTSDLRIYVESVGLATFPDGSVICGAMVQHLPSPQSTALNPTILVEVTSDSSEDYDTGFKLAAYQTIPSLEVYIVVSHRERRITVHRRSERGWDTAVASAGAVPVVSLAMSLTVDEVYRGSAIR